MTSSAKVGKTVAMMFVLAIVAVGAGLLIAFYMGSHGGLVVMPAPEMAHSQNPSPAVPPPVAPVITPVNVLPPSNVWESVDRAADQARWQEKLDAVLLGAGEPNDKADAIKRLMTNSPPEAKVELAQHLINMTQDDHYDGVAELVTNASTQTAVSTVLMNDLLNRRNSLKLPMLLAIARNDDHPLKDQAKDMLELFLQADYSTNWDQWSSAVDTWLQQNQ